MDERHDLLGYDRVETAGRFIQKDKAGHMNNLDADTEPLQLPP
jgi:hypothetical protein